MTYRYCLFVIVASLLHGCMVAGVDTESSTAATAADSQSAGSHGSALAHEMGSRLTPAEVEVLLAEHDRVRADVGVGPMIWSAELAAYAQNWGDQLVAKGCQFEHRPDPAFGENLFRGTEGAYTVADAVRSWEDEKEDYNGGALTETNWYDTGHYTQMVWRQTTRLGCASVACNGNMMIVCNYDPPGNMLGQRPY